MKEAQICEKLIKEKGVTVATAESCTGGLLASAFVDIAGSSNWFMEGCVTYTVEAKKSRLNVKQETIDKYTVVSREVAIEMAKGIRNNLHTDVGISTTGYAGPGGGDETNPAGTVYVGFSSIFGDDCIRLLLCGSRNEVRAQAVKEALVFLAAKLNAMPN